jgi:hypothetical protein
MKEQHPSFSAIGVLLDDEMETAALAKHYYEEEGRPEGHAAEHWQRAEQELHPQAHAAAPEHPATRKETAVEEAMHLDQ